MSAVRNDRNAAYFLDGVRIVWQLLGDQRKPITYGALALLGVQAISFSGPYLIKMILDTLPEVMHNGIDASFCMLLVLFAATPIIQLSVFHLIQEVYAIQGIIGFENELPMKIHAKLMCLHMGYHEQGMTGKRVAKIKSGCDHAINFVVNLFNVVLPCLFYLTINALIMLQLEWRVACLFFIPLILSAIRQKKMYDARVSGWEYWHKLSNRSWGILTQGVLGIATVQAYTREDFETRIFSQIREDMAQVDLNLHIPLQKELFVVGLWKQGAFIASVLLGIWLVYTGETGIGILAYLIATGNASMRSLQDLVTCYSRLMRDIVSIRRLRDILEEQEEVLNSKDAVVPQHFIGQFTFCDVRFRYSHSGSEVICGVSLDVSPGSMVAFVGPSGSGKSTLVKLLARVYDPSQGEVTLDGKPIKTIDRDWYRRCFAVVQQDVYIFEGTLEENISYGCEGNIPEEELLLALQAAHLGKTLGNKTRFNDGIQTRVGERGITLSGGERQRVGIARAYLSLLHGTNVLILDEATSSLDSEAELAIQEMVNDLRQEQNITIIAIAHRLSTIQAADEIHVLENGNIVESGNHAKLLRHNGLYARLVNLQQLGEIRED